MFSAKAQARKPAVVVDLDGTVARDDSDDLMSNEPQPGAREALRQLMDSGFDVVVFTCRTSRQGHPGLDASSEADEIKEWLEKNDVPYSRIDLGYDGKPHGVAYVDNKAIHYDGGEADWEKIVGLITSGGGHG